MTVCIAATCQTDTIIAVSDMMVSTGLFAADNMAMKFKDLNSQWKVMFAGNDVSRIEPLLWEAKRRVRAVQGRVSLLQMESIMRECFQSEIVQKGTDLVLARYGLTMQEFLDTGLARFGEATFTAMKYQLDQIELDCAFLVYGHDEKDDAHVFSVEDPGVICNHDLYGFWAIGSGSNRALSSLFFQNFRMSLPEPEALYYLAEAKFMAEGGAVGAETLVMIRRKDGSSHGSLSMDLIKKLWKRHGRPKMPRNAREIITRSMKEEFFVLSEPKPLTSQTSEPGK